MIVISSDNRLSTSILHEALKVPGKHGLCLLTYAAADRCRYYYVER